MNDRHAPGDPAITAHGTPAREAPCGSRSPGSRRRQRLPRASSAPLAVTYLAMTAVGMVVLIDAVLADRHWSVPVTALLDEPAHLLTAAVLLVAVLPARALPLAPWALVGAVLIDVDHVVLYLPASVHGHIDGRPVTHSLTTVLVLGLAGAAARGRWRTRLLGLATGVSLHLVRDLAAPIGGPGVSLLWPASTDALVLPYPSYLALLATGLAVVAVRQWRRGHPHRIPSDGRDPER